MGALAPTPLVTRPRLALLLLFVLAFLPGALLRVPFDVDEVRYVEVAREMRASGEWLVTQLNGETYSEKPPLFFWLVASLGAVVGEVRAGQLLAALSLAATGGFALRLGRLVSDGDERVGWLSAAASVTSVVMLDRGQSAVIDTLLLPLVTGSTLALLEAARADGRRALAWSAAGAALMALACLAKGPVGVLFPLLGALLAGPLTRGRAGVRASALVAAPLVAGGLTLLWVWVVSRVAGEWFQERMLGQIAKRTGGSTPHHLEPPWFYLLDLPGKLAPWIALLPGALLFAWRGPGSTARSAARACAIWAAAGLLLFSCVGGKRPGYVLPLYVPLAIACAAAVAATEEKGEGAWRRALVLPLRGVPLALVGLPVPLVLAPALGATAIALAPESAAAAAARAAPLAAWPLVPLLGLLGLALSRDAACAARDERWTRVAAILAGAMAIGGALLGLAAPILEPRRSGRVLAEEVTARVPPGERLVFLAGHQDGRIHLWTGARRYEVVQAEALGAELDRPGRLWLLGREAPFTEVEPAVRARLAPQVEWPATGRNDFVLWSER